MDAVRASDGDIVILKSIRKSRHPYEIEIARYFSTPPVSSDPRNHCCPVLDVLQDPSNADVEIMVMPLLRLFNEPPFATVGEVICGKRLRYADSLRFCAKLNVPSFSGSSVHAPASRCTSVCDHTDSTCLAFSGFGSDCGALNVMMDPRPILPNNFHPQAPHRNLDGQGFVKPYTRTARPVKYYFTDFGISRRYSADEPDPLEVPIFGGDKTVPEHLEDPLRPRNPFRTDVYYLGSLIRTRLLQVRKSPSSRTTYSLRACPGICESHSHRTACRQDGSSRTGQAAYHGRGRSFIRSRLVEDVMPPAPHASRMAKGWSLHEHAQGGPPAVCAYYSPHSYRT